VTNVAIFINLPRIWMKLSREVPNNPSSLGYIASETTKHRRTES